MFFCILNSKNFPIPRTHYLHVLKFAKGFEQNGFISIHLNSIQEIDFLSKNDIVYVSSHFFIEKTHILHKNYLFKSFVSKLKKSKAKFIFWAFHDVPDISNFLENRKHLFLTENFSNEWEMIEKKLSFYHKFNSHKLIFSSSLDDRNPFDKIKQHRDKIDFDFNFVGSKYKTNLLKKLNSEFNSYIRFYPPIQNEILRIKSFSKSKINLVFHSDSSIEKGFFTERFPEALSMGNIIVHDHPTIKREFDSEGIFFEVNYQKIIEILNQLTQIKIDEISEFNYKTWQTSNLSYRKQALEILEKLEK